MRAPTAMSASTTSASAGPSLPPSQLSVRFWAKPIVSGILDHPTERASGTSRCRICPSATANDSIGATRPGSPSRVASSSFARDVTRSFIAPIVRLSTISR